MVTHAYMGNPTRLDSGHENKPQAAGFSSSYPGGPFDYQCAGKFDGRSIYKTTSLFHFHDGPHGLLYSHRTFA